MKRLPGRRWCPVSQSPADDPESAPGWDAFSGDGTAPAPGPGLTALLGRAVAAQGDRESPAEEPGFEMAASAYSAGLLLDMAANIVTRLPATLAGMAAGVIDRDRARAISNATLHLPDDLAAVADKALAEAAPDIRLPGPAPKAAPPRGRPF